jgi:hypothetical protein
MTGFVVLFARHAGILTAIILDSWLPVNLGLCIINSTGL